MEILPLFCLVDCAILNESIFHLNDMEHYIIFDRNFCMQTV